MREVEDLGHGNWFPTPLRVVPVETEVILVGPVTTSELRRHFHGVSRAGYARVAAQNEIEGLPIQLLDHWTGTDVLDTVRWTESALADASANMGQTIASIKVQFFGFKKGSSKPLGGIPTWTNDVRSSIPGGQGMVLCRQPIGHRAFRYFIGQVKRSQLIAEAPAPRDHARMQFGLAALVGKPVAVITVSSAGDTIFFVPLHLPRPERRLALALGNCSVSSRGRAYRVHGKSFARLIAERMRNLGCEVTQRA
jgi:hypothetical protein